MTDLRKTLHILIVSLFALAGVSYALHALRSAWKLRTITGPYFEQEMSFLVGIVFLLAAVGLYRFDPRARVTAMALAGLNLLGGAAVLFFAPGRITAFFTAFWLAVWSFVLLWLFSSPVRAQFVAAKVQSKAV